jgi:uncharacterized protein (DUF849 family)
MEPNNQEGLARLHRSLAGVPDYASVNLSERDAPAVVFLLNRVGAGVEAGLATVADTERFVALGECRRALRILNLNRAIGPRKG